MDVAQHLGLLRETLPATANPGGLQLSGSKEMRTDHARLKVCRSPGCSGMSLLPSRWAGSGDKEAPTASCVCLVLCVERMPRDTGDIITEGLSWLQEGLENR